MNIEPRETGLAEIPPWQLDGGLAAPLGVTFPSLPRRCLFCNESVQVVLTGLLPGQAAWTVIPTRPILLIVTFGRLLVEVGGDSFTATTGRALALNPGLLLRLSATEHADFLLVDGSPSSGPGKNLKRLVLDTRN